MPACPKCGENANIVCHGKRYAVYPAGCLMMGGIGIAMLHQASGPMEYECGACGARFGVRSVWARIALGIFLLMALWLIFAIASALMNG